MGGHQKNKHKKLRRLSTTKRHPGLPPLKMQHVVLILMVKV